MWCVENDILTGILYDTRVVFSTKFLSSNACTTQYTDVFLATVSKAMEDCSFVIYEWMIMKKG